MPGSLPVLFFGDLFKAHVATVGINPSKQEYLTRSGLELTGSSRRFETLGSLGASSRPELIDEQCERAIDTMHDYYQPEKPVYGWFRALERVNRGMGLSYQRREVCHLDLVQEATDPTWTKLAADRPAEAWALREADAPFLAREIQDSALQAVVCNGRTVLDAVYNLLGATTTATGTLARLSWRVGTATVANRTIAVAGWNIPLARPTGLGRLGEHELGRMLANHVVDLVPGFNQS